MSLPAILLVIGVALCVASVVLAVVQLLRLQPPRLAVLALVAGILALFAGAQLQPGPFSPSDVATAFGSVLPQKAD
ncbi:hypothetical protein Q4511_10490 [Paracoccus sp. 1_MG-2023]|uniref:hypothetical protein n=1 Tax=unclassified Paracoccus (in: a-proteobacteria) TaxID=2688777 RepID=UPI001C080DCC|nr:MULTISPECIES: hypothetical protein [unclassified Paracoccus (in: a-proteobacteria)]MBU2958062.1 hypothetical protein [Paracoccus sp. C2R09]MDO6669352.1 hypothetical protein [Paracoccus sp. 1_MG-2023]